MGTKGKLTFKQKKFVKAITTGKSIHDSLVAADMSTVSRDSYGFQLLNKPQIRAALARAGITENYLSTKLKDTIDAGLEHKDTATIGDALRGIELGMRATGMLSIDKYDQGNTVNNVYIHELNTLSQEQLKNKLQAITASIID